MSGPAADRLAVIEACTRMAWHADEREWDALRDVFAEEVRLDYTSLQGGEPATVSRDQLVEAWAGLLGKLQATQHLVTNHLVTVSGDAASCTAAFQATHLLPNPHGDPIWTLGGTYRFELVRDGERWRISAVTKRRFVWAVGLGVGFAGVMTLVVLRTEEATSRPDGLELIGAVLWRGVLYGVTDGLLLSAFPILVVFAAFAGSRLNRRFSGKVVIGTVALIASLAMTAVYHAGYSDFRSNKISKPLTGDVVWSVPTLVTLNAIGAPIAHAGLHVSAVLHSYETDTFLPPHE